MIEEVETAQPPVKRVMRGLPSQLESDYTGIRPSGDKNQLNSDTEIGDYGHADFKTVNIMPDASMLKI